MYPLKIQRRNKKSKTSKKKNYQRIPFKESKTEDKVMSNHKNTTNESIEVMKTVKIKPGL